VCEGTLRSGDPEGIRPKKLLVAVYLARDPKWAPCESCNCVDGEQTFPKWEVKGEPIFPDGEGGYTSATRSCPRRLVTADSLHLLSLYRHYKAGHLYAAGGIENQPALFLTAMLTIEGALDT
jgi:hypothetical protein